MRLKVKALAPLGVGVLLSVFVTGQVLGTTVYPLLTAGSSQTINSAVYVQGPLPNAAGTGLIRPFLHISNTGNDAAIEYGYSTDNGVTTDNPFITPQWTSAPLLSSIPTVKYNGTVYREFVLDINQVNSHPLLSLDEVKIYLSPTATPSNYNPTAGTFNGSSYTKVYDQGDNVVELDYSLQAGSGKSDMTLLVADSNFQGTGYCAYGAGGCSTWLAFWTKFGAYNNSEWPNNDGFEEWATVVRPFVNVTKTAVPSFDRTYTWDISKSADPTHFGLFAGETGDADYGVGVVRHVSDSGLKVSGTITITNPGVLPGTSGKDAVTTPAAGIASVTDTFAGIDAVVTCPVTFSYSLAAGSTLTCTYTLPLNAQTNGTNTATVTLTDTTEPSYQGTATVDWSTVTPTVTGYPTVHVTDTNTAFAGPKTASGTASWTYDIPYTCPSAASAYTNGHLAHTVNNTAQITETGQTATASVTWDCYLLSASKTATPAFTRTYSWTIEKSVTPTSVNLFDGQTAPTHYTVVVTKTTTDSAWAVSGTIVVSNPAPMDATVTSLTDNITGIAGAINVTCPSMTVPAGGTLTCTYTTALPDITTRTNSVVLAAYGVTYPAATASVDFTGVTPTIVGSNSVDVSDTIGGTLGTTSSSNTYLYDSSVDCSGITYSGGSGSKNVPNTASLSTGQSADANVAVTCYRLSTSKTATPAFTRTYSWTIEKLVDALEKTANMGDIVSFNYTVRVNGTSADSAWAVSGTVVVSNPAPMDATVTSVVDNLAGVGDLTVTCPSMTVPAGGSLTCTYSSSLPDASTRLNSAMATAYGVDYPTSTSVDFTGVNPTIVGYQTIHVTDSYAGALGTATIGVDTMPKEFLYTRTIDTTSLWCGDYAYPNTATITETGQNASLTVTLHIVNCGVRGKTMGFWSNKNGNAVLDATAAGADTMLPVTLGIKDGNPIHRWVTISLVSQSNLILKFAGGDLWSPTIKAGGLADKINGTTFYNLAAQTLALQYNISYVNPGHFPALTQSFAGQTLASLGCTVPTALKPYLSSSSKVEDVLAVANTLIANTVKGGTTTQATASAMVGMLGGCVNTES